jgi:hypothetical protein
MTETRKLAAILVAYGRLAGVFSLAGVGCRVKS